MNDFFASFCEKEGRFRKGKKTAPGEGGSDVAWPVAAELDLVGAGLLQERDQPALGDENLRRWETQMSQSICQSRGGNVIRRSWGKREGGGRRELTRG